MRINKHDWKKGTVNVTVEGSDDIWTLSTVIEPGDTVSGSTERKIKLSETNVVRKRVTLTIDVEKSTYSGNELRVLGTITHSPEDVPHGEHHSFLLVPGTRITIEKSVWPRYQKTRLEEATKSDSKILILLFDREVARFFSVTKRGVENLARMKGSVQKKEYSQSQTTNFYKELVKKTLEYEKSYDHIVAGAPAFWREYLEKELTPELKKKTVVTTISAVEKTAIRELLARPEVKKLLKESTTLKELSLVEEALSALGKNHLAYGLEEVKRVVDGGNVSTLLVTEGEIKKARKEEKGEELERLLLQCESSRGEVHILTAEEATGKIDGLGGVVAVKRW